jgi:hypothetical protein
MVQTIALWELHALGDVYVLVGRLEDHLKTLTESWESYGQLFSRAVQIARVPCLPRHS